MGLDVAPLNDPRIVLTVPTATGFFFWAEDDTGIGRKSTVSQIFSAAVAGGVTIPASQVVYDNSSSGS
jgi:hypothetical protein